ncbi:SpoIID/LytB domain-containing protein [Agathobaculum butyriciproducens]|uniref:SpoIID/LytB domain-containing protein n=1 Tax=Agathobaculum butyriciproducens TaxID=1628085 RepID=UPI0036D3573B
MHRLLLTGVGLVLVLYLLPVFYPSETDKTEPQAPAESVTAAATDGLTITVLVNGKAQEMPLETYVEGVTAAEIADDFPVEAIREQAGNAGRYPRFSGAGAVFAAGILPIGNGQDGAAGTHRKRHSGSNRRLNHHGSGERQGAGNAAGDLCGRRDGGRDCGRFSG